MSAAANNTQLCEERGAEGHLSILIHPSKYSEGLGAVGMPPCGHSLTSLLLSLLLQLTLPLNVCKFPGEARGWQRNGNPRLSCSQQA